MNAVYLLLFVVTNFVNAVEYDWLELAVPLEKYNESCGYRSCPEQVEDYLNVHLVPYSQMELGCSRTFDEHFTGGFRNTSTVIGAKRIFDAVITALWTKPKRTFTVASLSFFFHWWSKRDGTVRRMAYELIRTGRLSFVGSGWSNADEAASSYQMFIDHHTYGLRKLNATFLECGRPLVAWQPESFGHSKEIASLLAQMGYDGLFVNPISMEDELARMTDKAFDFIWRSSDDIGATSEIFTNKLFDGYWSPPGFCFGRYCRDPLLITSDSVLTNVKERVQSFIKSMKLRQAPYYRTNNIMVVMGQKESYHDAEMWYSNIDKLISYVNLETEAKINVQYSAPHCYLQAVHKQRPTLPMKKDDFFPVAYDSTSFLTGHFTTRPYLKRMIYILNTYSQISSQIQVLANLGNNDAHFEEIKSVLGMVQDHSIITGGLTDETNEYYMDKIRSALHKCLIIITKGINKFTESKRAYSTCTQIGCSQIIGSSTVTIYNPLSWPVTMPVRLSVNDAENVFVRDCTGKTVKTVTLKIPEPMLKLNKRKIKQTVEIVFITNKIPPLGLRSYYVEFKNRVKREMTMVKEVLPNNKKHNILRQIKPKITEEPIDFADLDQYEDLDTTTADPEFLDFKESFKGKIPSDDEVKSFYDNPKLLNDDSDTEFSTTTDNVHTNKYADGFNELDNKNLQYDKDIQDGTVTRTSKMFVTTEAMKTNEENNNFDNVSKVFNNTLNTISSSIYTTTEYVKVDKGHETSNNDTKVFNDTVKETDDHTNKSNTNAVKEETEVSEPTEEIATKDNRTELHSDDTTLNYATNTPRYSYETTQVYIVEVDQNNSKILDNSTHVTKANLEEVTARTDFNETSTTEVGVDIKKYDSVDYIVEDIKISTEKQLVLQEDDDEKYYKHIPTRTEGYKNAFEVTNEIDNLVTERVANTESLTVKTYVDDEKHTPSRTESYKNAVEVQTDVNNEVTERVSVPAIEETVSEKQTPWRTESYTQSVNLNTEVTEVVTEKVMNFVPVTEEQYADAKKQTTSTESCTQSVNLNNEVTGVVTEKVIHFVPVTEKPYADEKKQTTSTESYTQSVNLNNEVTGVVTEKVIHFVPVTEKPYADENKYVTIPVRTESYRDVSKDLDVTESNEIYRKINEDVENITFDKNADLVNNNDTTGHSNFNTSHVENISDVNNVVDAEIDVKESKKYTTEKDNTVRRRFKTKSTKSRDTFIQNKHLRIDLHPNTLKMKSLTLSNNVTIKLDIKFYMYDSDDPERLDTEDRPPGAYIMRAIGIKPTEINKHVKSEIHKTDLVEEIRLKYSDYAYMSVILYKDAVDVEIDWIAGPLPIGPDEVGKEMFIRYETDLVNDGVFYTDANGRQTVKRTVDGRQGFNVYNAGTVEGNLYPVTSKIYIEDPNKNIRFAVFNDRCQGGTSFTSGTIDLMILRRILTEDSSVAIAPNYNTTGEGIVRGKHHIYLSKADYKPNKIYEKKLAKEINMKPQLFIAKVHNKETSKINEDIINVNRKIPLGIHVLTLDRWGDSKLLLRLENYLEKADVVNDKAKIVYLKELFVKIKIVAIRETTLSANQWIEDWVPLQWKKNDLEGEVNNSSVNYAIEEDLKPLQSVDLETGIELFPQQIRTFVIKYDNIKQSRLLLPVPKRLFVPRL